MRSKRLGQASVVVYVSQHSRRRVFRATIEKTNIVSRKESVLRVPSVHCYSLRLNVRLGNFLVSTNTPRIPPLIAKNIPMFFIATSRYSSKLQLEGRLNSFEHDDITGVFYATWRIIRIFFNGLSCECENHFLISKNIRKLMSIAIFGIYVKIKLMRNFYFFRFERVSTSF